MFTASEPELPCRSQLQLPWLCKSLLSRFCYAASPVTASSSFFNSWKPSSSFSI
ncbi:mCG147594 [Mus musculus]|nr:mCG147594 [Mus musculus]